MKLFSSIKAKILAFVGLGAVAATNAAAAVTVDSGTGVVTGDLNLAPFLSVFALVIVAAAVMWSVRRALGLISK